MTYQPPSEPYASAQPDSPPTPYSPTPSGFIATAPPPSKRRPWKWIALAAGIVVILLAGGIFYFAARDTGPTLAAVDKTCNRGRSGTTLADGGKTLIVDNQGAHQQLAGVDVETEACILRGLGTPASVISHMSQTRALDGRQSDSWGEFRAAWTYHPDDGLDITITQR